MVSKNSSPNLKFKRGCLMIVMLITFSLALSSQDLVLRYHPPSNTIRGFQQNIGQFKNENNQTNENVKYSLALPGMNVCINESGFSYNTYKIISEPRNPFKSFQKRDLDIYRKNKVQVHRIDVVFEGMNPDCKLVPLNNINSKKRYINRAGKCENANSFQQITYKNIYPNIDL